MDKDKIEDICKEYRLKPYRMHGDNLPFYFGEIMDQTDKWLPFPFELNERFIDFVRGLQELNNVELPKLNEAIHLKKDYTGFVELDPSKNFRYIEGFSPWAGFIDSGTFKYAQSESKIDDEIISKNSLFIKNGFNLEIYSVSVDEEEENECKIMGISRETYKNLPNSYRANILQIPGLIRIMINTNNDTTHRETIKNIIDPLIEVNFKNGEYNEMLNMLESGKDIFRDFNSIRDVMGEKYVCPHSRMFEIIGKKQEWKITNRENTMNLNEAIYMLEYFANHNK